MSNWTTDASAPVTGGPSSAARYAAVADDGTIYVLGNAYTMYIYNPVANSWSTVSPTGGSFSVITGACWVGGVVYALVYVNGTTQFWAYNPSSNAWSAKTALSGTKTYLQCAAVGSRIYVVSYNYSEFLNIYDIVHDTWSTGATPPEAAQKFILTGSSSTLYMLCTRDSGNNPEKTAHAYNVSSNTWSNLAAPSIYGSVATFGNGKVFYAGDGTTTVDVFDTSAGTWSTASGTNLPAARSDLMGGSGSLVMYMLCGDDSTSTAVSTVYAYSLNNPPNTAAWSSPPDGVTLNRAVDQVLTYVFSDPDAGDSQSERQWRYSTDGGSTWTTTTDVTTSTSITIPASTFANGDTVQVQVKPADSTGTYALSWSASLHLTFEDAPTPPTITAPTSGATIGSSTETVTFSCPSLTQYKYRVVGDNGSGGADTGTVYVAETTITNPSSRAFMVTGLPNSVTVHIEIAIYNNGLWSDWADQANPVSYDPPPTPTVTITAGTDTITVTVATAAPGTGEVAAASVTVENSTDGSTPGDWSRSSLPINGDVIYRTPASGQAYWFRATAVASNGVTAVSTWTS